MKRFSIETSKVEKAFKEAYKEQKKMLPEQLSTEMPKEDPWTIQVMRRIRTLEPVHSPFDFSVVFERMFWRFASAGVVVICLLSIWLFQVDVTVEYDMVSLFMTDPIGFSDMPSLKL